MNRALLLVASTLGAFASQSLAATEVSRAQTLDRGGRMFSGTEEALSYDTAQLNPSLSDLVSGAASLDTFSDIDFGDGVGRVPGDASSFVDVTSGWGLLSTSDSNNTTVEEAFEVGASLESQHNMEDLNQEDLPLPPEMIIFGGVAVAAMLVRNAKGFWGPAIR